MRLRFEARTDAPTVVGLTTHAYFNLDGDDAGPVDDQLLRVAADTYLPVDDPASRRIRPVEGTPFDLRQPTHRARRIAEGGFDHNFVLSETGPHPAAALASDRTHSRMDLVTDQPGLQVYSGAASTGREVPPPVGRTGPGTVWRSRRSRSRTRRTGRTSGLPCCDRGRPGGP